MNSLQRKYTLEVYIFLVSLQPSYLIRDQTLLERLFPQSSSDIILEIMQAQKYHCPLTQMCQDVNNYYPEHANYRDSFCCRDCKCTSRCLKRGDCCPDYIPQLESHMSQEDTTQLPDEVCRSQLVPFSKESYTIPAEYFYMIESCKVHSPNKRQCEDNTNWTNIETVTPVYSYSTRTIFKNVYCAECNKIQRTDLLWWSAKTDCPQRAININGNLTYRDVAAVSSAHHCGFIFTPPKRVNIVDSVCFGQPVRECNTTGHWTTFNTFTAKACKSYNASYVEYTSGTFANVFCFQCNARPSLIPYCVKDDSRFRAASLTLLFEFNTKEFDREVEYITKAKKTEDKKCTEEQVYDPYTNSCLDVSQPLYITKTRSPYVSTRLFIQMTLTPENPIPWFACRQFWSQGLRSSLLQMLDSYRLEIGSSICTTVARAKRDIDFNVQYVIVTYGFPTGVENNLTEYTEIMNNIEEIFRNLKSVNTSFFCFDKPSIPSVKNSSYFNVEFERSYGYLQPITNAHSWGLQYLDYELHCPGDPFDPNAPENIEVREIVDKFAVCSYIRLPVVAIIFEPDGVQFNVSCKAVRIKSSDMLIESKKNGIVVCKDTYNAMVGGVTVDDCENPELEISADVLAEVSDRMTNVSFGLSCISVVCLMLTFITYCVFNELRNKPGKLNMLLCINLIIAQILFQFGVYEISNNVLCKAIGISIHFFWLAYSCSMNVCCIHILKVFVVQHRDCGCLPWPNFLCYIIITYAVPLLILFITVMVSLVQSGFEKIPYGDLVCFLNKNDFIILGMAVPIGVIIVCNFVILLVVIHRIYITKEPQGRHGGHNRNNLVIYLKLLSLTGVMLCLAYVYEFSKNVVLGYIFVIINGSQGIFIFVSVVFNTRVYELFRTKWRRHLNSGTFVLSDIAGVNTDKFE